MAKYLLLKHYRGAPAPVNDVPMDQWKPDEVEAHIQFMQDFAGRLESERRVRRRTGAVTGRNVGPLDGDGRPPVTDGPFAETKDLIAGWMVIDVDSLRASRRARRRAVGSAWGRRQADQRVARGPTLPDRAPERHPVTRERCRAPRARPSGPQRPRPSRCRLRDGRGRCTGGAHPGALGLGGRAARRTHGLADHRRVESVPRHDAVGRRRATTERSDSTPNRRPARSRAPTTRCASTSCARTPS